MPIGFWAVSRGDLQQLIAFKANGDTPTNQFLDKAVGECQGKLETVLDEIAEKYASEIRKETAELQSR